MSSTLHIRKTPTPSDAPVWDFKQPVKGWFGRRYYDHDGSLGGNLITIPPTDLPWLEGLLLAGNIEYGDRQALERIAELLRGGDCIDIWFST